MSEVELIRRAGSHGTRPAIRAPERTYSYGDLLAASERAAGALLEESTDLGEARVAFLVPEGFRYVAVQWGIWRAGGIAVPLSASAREPELEHVLTDSEACLVVGTGGPDHRLERLARRLGIPVHENRLAVSLLVLDEEGERRVAGAIVLNCEKEPEGVEPSSLFEIYAAENVIFAVGGPGGLYRTSVYPEVHTGGIGLALLAGAEARNLIESQYGLSSVKFRWNVSGSYMQVIPRFVSTEMNGGGGAREFLRAYFDTAGEMNSAVFLKGYQWPFDTEKIIGGSSIVDILVYIETVVKRRRVFLDFRSNSEGFEFDDLMPEARE